MDRSFDLKEPVDAETLWHRLAKILPAIVRLHVPDAHRDEPTLAQELAGTPLPELCGPTPEPTTNSTTRRGYDCSERGLYGSVTLSMTGEDLTHRSISVLLLHRTISPGLIVLSMWNIGSPIATGVGFSCHFDMIDGVLGLLQNVNRKL